MDTLFDEEHLTERAERLAEESRAAALPPAEARAKAREDLLVAGVLLGMEDVLGDQVFGDCAGLPDRVAFRLHDAQVARAELRAALPGALRFNAGQGGTDADGYESEDAAAAAAFLMLGFGSLLTGSTASSQYLSGLPRDQAEHSDQPKPGA